MIAIEAMRTDTDSLKIQNFNQRGKLSKNKLRRVRPRSSRPKKPGTCQQPEPVPPATSRAACEKAAFRLRRQQSYTLLPGSGTSKSDSKDKNAKLPRLKSNSSAGEGKLKRNKSNSGDTSGNHKLLKRRQSQTQSQNSKTSIDDGDKEQAKPKKTKSVYILEAIKPNNVLREKEQFMRLHGRYNPQFEYDNPASEKALRNYSQPSNKLIQQACKIMEQALQQYGSYEAFEEAIAGKRLTEAEFTWLFQEFVSAEGLQNRVHLNLTPDLLSRAVMTRLRSRPTMNVNSKVLREGWAQGLLQHEIGTHYIRSANNHYQPWHNNRGRKRHHLLPMNPTEEGLASLNSVLGREDPCLWRSAMLYYVVYQASLLPFSELFEHLGRYIRSPEVRWDYCMRAKRGQVDTSLPGCFNKDQVYLTGALQVLRFRHDIDFHALVKMGRVAFQDVERLRHEAVLVDDVVSVPAFMADQEVYLAKLSEILLKNGLTEKELLEAFPSMANCF